MKKIAKLFLPVLGLSVLMAGCVEPDYDLTNIGGEIVIGEAFALPIGEIDVKLGDIFDIDALLESLGLEPSDEGEVALPIPVGLEGTFDDMNLALGDDIIDLIGDITLKATIFNGMDMGGTLSIVFVNTSDASLVALNPITLVAGTAASPTETSFEQNLDKETLSKIAQSNSLEIIFTRDSSADVLITRNDKIRVKLGIIKTGGIDLGATLDGLKDLNNE